MNINHTRNTRLHFYPSLIFPPKAPVDVTTWTDILGVIWSSVSQGSELSANKEIQERWWGGRDTRWCYFNQPISATDRKGKNCHYSIIGRKIKSPGISGGRWLVVHAESGNLIKTKGPPPVHWKKGRDYRANLLRIFLRFTEPSIRFKCREETLPFIGTFSSLHIKL